PFNVTISGGVTCIENWTCTEWSACGPNNIRVRTCIDRNSCGTTVNKPPEQQYCPYSAPAICAAPCPTGYYQRPYPDCSCVPLTCASACPAGYVQNP
ncbi:MAG: hypothetical protein QW112_02950, partial [Candidatus Micrarchaeia archaeon]